MPEAATEPPLAGLFVGGAGRRMGGAPKGLLLDADGTTLLARSRALLEDLGLDVVLVGEGATYAAFGLETLADDPPGIGPLGGLVALLRRAGAGRTLALACDMPFVSRDLLRRLIASPAAAPIIAPRRDGVWEPFCARYDAAAVLPLAAARARAGPHGLQGLLDEAGAAELPLTPREAAELHDWDTPEDMTRPPPSS